MDEAPSDITPGTVWLDTARPDRENARSWVFRTPVDRLVAQRRDEVVPVLQAAEQARRQGRWVAGYVAYEAAGAWLPMRLVQSVTPLVWLGVYDAPSNDPPGGYPPAVVEPLTSPVTEAKHAQAVAAIRRLIREGDVYQVNYTFPLIGSFVGSLAGLYEHLRAQQPVPYGACIRTERGGVVSLSPELFFRVEGRRIWTRPMKGTAPRGRTTEDDARIKAWLGADEKNRAENLMIVDLLRNDLSRVAQPGSVQVPTLFETEAHPTLHQMTSTVEATLRPDVGLPELFEALFPSGSVTGAPKHRAMQRIADLEPYPRGVYCGAIGFAAPHDEMVFSVPIRTLAVDGDEVRMGVGSGIVWDSQASEEYRECLLKARYLSSGAAP